MRTLQRTKPQTHARKSRSTASRLQAGAARAQGLRPPSPNNLCPRRWGPEIASKLLAERFARDKTADWRVELHRRRTAMSAADSEIQVRPQPRPCLPPPSLPHAPNLRRIALPSPLTLSAQASEAVLATARGALSAAEALLAASLQAAADAEAAGRAALEEDEDGGLPPPPPAYDDEEDGAGPEEHEPSPEELAVEAARAAVAQGEARLRSANEAAGRTAAVQNDPWVHYQPYTVSGMAVSLASVQAALAAGTPLRAVVWAEVPPQPPAEPAATEAAAAEPPAPSWQGSWFADVKGAAEAALWDDPLAQLAPVVTEVPAYTPPPAATGVGGRGDGCRGAACRPGVLAEWSWGVQLRAQRRPVLRRAACVVS
jgi:CRISPR-associated protein Cas5t